MLRRRGDLLAAFVVGEDVDVDGHGQAIAAADLQPLHVLPQRGPQRRPGVEDLHRVSAVLPEELLARRGAFDVPDNRLRPGRHPFAAEDEFVVGPVHPPAVGHGDLGDAVLIVVAGFKAGVLQQVGAALRPRRQGCRTGHQ